MIVFHEILHDLNAKVPAIAYDLSFLLRVAAR